MEKQSGLWEMKCPKCDREKIVKNGKVTLKDNSSIQKYRCRGCTQRFNERTGTPMARLRTPAMMVSMAIKARTEGMGVRATGRVLDKSHATIIRWEQRLAAQVDKWSPVAPSGAEVTIEGDEVYTQQRREPFPPQQVKDIGRVTRPVDNPFDRTGKQILDRRTSRTQKC